MTRAPPPPPLLLLLLLTLSCSFFACDAKRAGADHGGGITEEITMKLNKKRAPPSTQEAAARGVLHRLLPSHLSSFQFQVQDDACGGAGCFRITNVDRGGPEIMIQGTTGVEVVAGLHWYLKYWCGAHISWDKTGGSQLGSVPTPGSLPRVDPQGVTVKRPVPWNYYQNVVTSSYSYVWWNWERWEKEVDWMALQGVNLPLAFTGQEAIWQKVFKDFNISSESLANFFGGPAFLAWARMGNLHAWGGPLSQIWLDQQLALQKLILSRMMELGMTPVLPSFSGNVPAAFKKIYPSANITRLGDWNTVNGNPRWCCTFLLDPADPLFVKLGEAFIKQQIKEYGDVTDIYNCDTFNENEPPTDDPLYISSLGAAVYKAMSKGDADAIWLMQGWLFSSDSAFWKPPQLRAILHSVPIGKMIVLDLFAEVKPIWKSSSHFYGVPYVWCMLHNFGGNIEMYGILDAISSGPIEAHRSKNSTMIGVGMCMEGIEQNPVVYELMSEMAFRSEKVQLEEWLKSYSYRRYGRGIYYMKEAWKILYHTIYNCTDGIADHNKDFIVELPDSGPFSKDPHISNEGYPQKMITQENNHRFSFRETHTNFPVPHLWYSTKEVINALKLFLHVGNDLRGSLTFRYDLVDLMRQVLAKLANQVYYDVMSAYDANDANGLILQSQKFLKLIEDIDTLLASDDNFLLGTWLESAKKLAASQEEQKQYEWNARTQVTMWYDTTRTNQSKLHDYANKYWSGLLKEYYLPRASAYFKYLSVSLKGNINFPLESWREEWITYSKKWQAGSELYKVKAEGDALAISKALFSKYLS
ncbi:alpha-N-acetylglucosaminidase isoform X2 [Asparagus officinalis]|uniref:alpha-N-acetylglucosaminidase isoform X2 n=1 Tax=Asparagus officinalis TaxID=4686 RepID=UPI00098E72A0|nr:alpha-N-acetylglucosaminidase isoform X2 [Asparagus officinalis]